MKHYVIAPAVALITFLSACTSNSDWEISCCTKLPIYSIGESLGFEVIDKGMHCYYFRNDSRSFNILASRDFISLYDNDKKIWEIDGPTTAETVESKIREYLSEK